MHVNPQNGIKYYWNSETCESTYEAPPHLAQPKAPRTMTSMRTVTFATTDGQLNLINKLNEQQDTSSNARDVDVPTSPTTTESTSSFGHGRKTPRRSPHQRALAMASEPGMTMAIQYATETSNDGKIMPPEDHAVLKQAVAERARPASVPPARSEVNPPKPHNRRR